MSSQRARTVRETTRVGTENRDRRPNRLQPTLIFQNGRLYVGRSYGDFQAVWYTPINNSEDEKTPSNKIALYWSPRGEADDRSPLYKAVAWEALWNPDHIQCKDGKTRAYLHEQLLHDVWNYMTNKLQDREAELRARLEGSGTNGLHIAVTAAAVKLRNQRLRARDQRVRRRALAQGKRPDEVDSATSDDDSGFGSDYDDGSGTGTGTGGGLNGGPGGLDGSGGGVAYDDDDDDGNNTSWPRTRNGDGSSQGYERESMGPPPRPRTSQKGHTLRTRQQQPSVSPSTSISSQNNKRAISSISRDYTSEALGSPAPSFRRDGSLGFVRDSVETDLDAPASGRRRMNGSASGLWRTQESEKEANDRRFLEDTAEAMKRSKKTETMRPTLDGQLPRQSRIINLDEDDDSEEGGDEADQTDEKPMPSRTSQPDRSSLLKPFATPDATQPQHADMQVTLREAEAARSQRRSRTRAEEINGSIDEDEALALALEASVPPEDRTQGGRSPSSGA